MHKDQVHELHNREENIVHFLNAQLTYLRDLDHLSKFNTKAVEVLSQQVKTIMLHQQKANPQRCRQARRCQTADTTVRGSSAQQAVHQQQAAVSIKGKSS
jgi:hypothetical protein